MKHGNPAYTVVQLATNGLIILVAFVPIVKFLPGVSNVVVDSFCGAVCGDSSGGRCADPVYCSEKQGTGLF